MKTKKIGLRRKTTTGLWLLLIGSVLFGVYKNFTAIDQHTIHEEKIIETKVEDTHLMTSFVEDFVNVYYSWEPNKEQLEKRNEQLKTYLPEHLQQLNQEMIRSDIPTKSTVTSIKILNVTPINETDYSVRYALKQAIEEDNGKKKENREVTSAFSVNIRTNHNNQISILSNPVFTALPKKMTIKEELAQDDLGIDQETKEEIKEFLSTFFKIYPTAKKTELGYYVKDQNIKEINKAYTFSEIQTINYFKSKNGVKVKVVVIYLDKETKAILPLEYELELQKVESKWRITNEF